jgi:DNA polymerase delta subunit 1
MQGSFILRLVSHINAPQNKTEQNAVIDLQIVKKKSLWGYKGDSDVAFLKVILSTPRMVPKVRSAFEKQELDFNGLFNKSGIATPTYESNILYVLRFMIDTKVSYLGI